MDSIGETELQSTYFDPVLASILSNPQQNVVLRWANKNKKHQISALTLSSPPSYNQNMTVLWALAR
jgi:hypothetical protein